MLLLRNKVKQQNNLHSARKFRNLTLQTGKQRHE